ncbi:MAG: hypothetical protein N3G76_03195 [Candidatus Micrarchaeota archaeon]|nr:hypothetical protein [Candidatus Micrarchaeota archaeon]
MNGRRAQSSVEYLMTYGWAFIILLAVIAILYSFGVFNPQQYMGEECLFQPSLQCKSMSFSTKGDFSLVLSNGLGYRITITGASLDLLSTGQKNVQAQVSSFAEPNGQITINAKFDNKGTFRTSTLEKVKVTIRYKIEGSGTEYTTSGVVAVRTGA